jgi:ectoine hydroxylase-related dioxygenase (phytanoyl-CoA dioxygenase family)
MEFAQIMRELGADSHPLTLAQREQIRNEGYLILEQVFTIEQISCFREALESLRQEMSLGIAHGDGGYRIHDLIGRPAFDLAWSHPVLLAVARAWLGQEFKPMSVNYRCPLPGGGRQALHSDQTASPYCQALIPLCQLTSKNGAPRVVPRTHLHPTLPTDEMADVTAPHPREMLFTGAIGSVLFFDGNLWHSGTQNDSSQPRPLLHAGFMCRHADSTELEKQRGVISPGTYQRMRPALRNFLDYRVVDPQYVLGEGAGHAPLAVR